MPHLFPSALINLQLEHIHVHPAHTNTLQQTHLSHDLPFILDLGVRAPHSLHGSQRSVVFKTKEMGIEAVKCVYFMSYI